MRAATSLTDAAAPAAPLRGELLATVYRRPLVGQPAIVRVPHGSTIAEIAEASVADPVLRRYLVAYVAGDEIPVEAWETTRPAEGAAVVFALRPGDSKILRAALAIAVVVAATWISGGSATPAALDWAAPYLAATFAVAGNLAINALVPLDTPSAGETPAFHSVTGARNVAKPFESVPMLLGRHRHVPPVWGRYVQETIGDDIWMRGVFCLGPAPCAVSELRIGETLLSAFPDAEVEMRLNADDPPHTLYVGDPDTEVLGTKLDTEWMESETADDVDEFEVVFGFREGLGATDPDNGKKASIATNMRIEYRLAGSADAWVELRANAQQANEAAASAGEPDRRVFFGAHGLADWILAGLALSNPPPVGAIHYARAEPGRAFQKVERFAVPRGKYAVRARRDAAEATADYISDGCWWEYLNSRRTYVDAFPERGLASIALRIKATDQISGVVDTFNLLQESIVPVFSEAAFASPAAIDAASPASLTTPATSRNPAELVLNLYRGPQAMRPRPDSRIDWPAWAGFAKFCADNGLHFDEIVDGEMSRGEMARRVCAAGYGRPIRWAGKLSVVWDRDRGDDPPEQVFTPRNVSGLRWQKTFAPAVHAVRVSFANEENGYNADEVILYAEGYAAETGEGAEAATIFETLSVPGKTNPDEVRQVARQFWNNAEFQTERFNFEMDAEHLTVRPGGYAELQHDIMGTGLGSARVAALIMAGGDVAGFTLDAPIETQDGDTLGARWRKLVDDDGKGRFEVATELAVFRDAGDARTFTFAAPIDVADAPTPKGEGYEGDPLLVGVTEQVSLAVLVREILPEAGYRAALTVIPYAPGRFTPDGEPLPAHDPKVTLPFAARPAQPVSLGVNATAREISLAFQQPASPRGITLTGFECAWRTHGDDQWTALGPLNADERLVVAPAGDPGDHYDLFVQAVGRDSGGMTVRSDALIVSNVAAQTVPAQPEDCNADFEVRTSPSGAKQLVLVATWAALNDPDVVDTGVEIDTGGGWARVGGARASLGKAEVHGLQVGRTYDFGFVHVTRRGGVSARTVVEGVEAPDTLVATAAQSAAPGSELEIDLAAAAAALAGSEAAQAAAEAAQSAAATAATNAATAQAAAEDALDDAEDAAAAAATSATSAGSSASAASGSAATASTQATNAANSASAANTSKVAAQTAETNAGGSASAAASSASSAASSQSAAATSASAASTSATNAATSAGAASTSASNAATSATTASGHASTASTQATNAANSATAAAGSATAASGSASTASTQATNAGNSATAAQASQVAARSSAAALVPDTFTDPAQWINFVGSPVISGGVMVADTFEGMYSRGYIPLVAGHTYRLTMRHRVTVDAGTPTDNRSQWGLPVYTNAGAYTWNYYGSGANIAIRASDGWVTSTRDVLGNDILTALGGTAAFVGVFGCGGRNAADTGASGATTEFSLLSIRDVTESAAAAGSASAASTSASSAGTHATNAGVSASAAASSATTAATQAGNAAASAGTAASQASAASASAASASTSAATTASLVTGVQLVRKRNFLDSAKGLWGNTASPAPIVAGSGNTKYNMELRVRTQFCTEGDASTVLTGDLGGRKLRVRSTVYNPYAGQIYAGLFCYNKAGSFLGTSVGVAAGASAGHADAQFDITPPSGTVLAFACVFHDFSDATIAATAPNYYGLCALDIRDANDLAAAEANVAINTSAISTINGSAAFLELVASASGGDLGAFRLRAGAGGSFIELISTVLRLANTSNGSVIEVMRAIGGQAYFSRPVSVDGGGKRVTIGPGYGVSGQEVVLWFGPDSIAPSSQSRTNGYFSFGTDSNPYLGNAILLSGNNPLTASFSPSSYSSTKSGGTASISEAVTVTPGGGSGSYSVSWAVETLQSGPAATIANAATATATIQVASIGPGVSARGRIRCTITDTANGRQKAFYWSYSLVDTL